MAKSEEKLKVDDKAGTPGPTSTPAGTATPANSPRRTRTPRTPAAAALTQGDLKVFEKYLTTDIDAHKADATDDQLETWFATRRRVRGLITNAGGAQ